MGFWDPDDRYKENRAPDKAWEQAKNGSSAGPTCMVTMTLLLAPAAALYWFARKAR